MRQKHSNQHQIPTVGVVLTGGGLRGPFQAGVLAGLEFSGVRIAAVSGTSAGALNALSYLRCGAQHTVERWRLFGESQLLTLNVLGLLVRILLFGFRDRWLQYLFD